ncbi:unnamed protein product [Eruca vesicaria subsp. sativa]|uniref:Uncharacterized protein n=1 Tax=Eruca vesicaria subsp. sativa TaxID=29727 RepID=A0ABC8IW80_ERUVS|nr:unnamed protein product [Eruca vesicaria subsp. sativa]
MAPKDKIENPPVASSSEEEEEEEESGSSEEESASSDEGPGDVQSKPTQKPPAATKKPESDSEEGESESESDSDSEPPTKTKPLNTVVTKPIPSLPESSSTAKRSLKQADNEPKKKAKTSSTDEQVKTSTKTDEDVKKNSMFQRLFSETDEIAMLQGFLDFTSTKGDPSENMDAFCEYVKTLIDFNASKAQIVTKLQRCKKKFVNIVKNSLKKGKTEDKITCAKDLDQKAFELSRKIWGSDGVLPAKQRKMSKEVELVSTPKKEVKVSVVGNHRVVESREVATFFKAENVSVLGLDEATLSGVWDMVEDGVKKREMEEKVKMLKAKQMELCLQRTALVDYTAKMIFKNNASSSSS